MGKRLDMVRQGALYSGREMDVYSVPGIGSVQVAGVQLFFNSVGIPFRVMSYVYAGRDRLGPEGETDIFYPVCQMVGGTTCATGINHMLPQFFTVPMYFQDSMKEEDLCDLWELYECFAGKGGHVMSYDEYKGLVSSTGIRII